MFDTWTVFFSENNKAHLATLKVEERLNLDTSVQHLLIYLYQRHTLLDSSRNTVVSQHALIFQDGSLASFIPFYAPAAQIGHENMMSICINIFPVFTEKINSRMNARETTRIET